MKRTDPLLEVKHLQISFQNHGRLTRVVHDVNFRIDRGASLGLVGESGCGKSITSLSVMHLLPGYAEVAGEINFNGENLLPKKEKEMEKIRGNQISMIFQDPMTSLNPVLTVGNQIEEVIRYHQGGTKQEIKNKAAELIDLVKIPDGARRLEQYPHQLSGGIRQRVMIAMALACNPKLLIADEPTTALDVTIQAQILGLIRELQETLHTAVLFISHDLAVIAQIADDVAVMYAGEIVEYASVQEIFSSPKHPYTKGLIRAIPRIDRSQPELEEIPGAVPDFSREFTGCRFYPRCPDASAACKNRAIDLRKTEDSEVRCLLYTAGKDRRGHG